MDKERKGEIINQFRLKDNDTGSVEVQVALLTERINRLTEHLKLYPQDRHTRHKIQRVIGRQRRLLNYLGREDAKRHHSLVTRLGLRK